MWGPGFWGGICLGWCVGLGWTIHGKGGGARILRTIRQFLCERVIRELRLQWSGDPSTRINDVENVEIVFKDRVGYDSQKLIDLVNGRYGEYRLLLRSQRIFTYSSKGMPKKSVIFPDRR
jgi:hypothetical protein